MRTLWLILATVAVIVIVTVVYTLTQSAPPHHPSVVQRLAAEASPSTTRLSRTWG